MSLKIKRKLKSVDIPHPQDPSFTVTVRRLGKVEALNFFQGLQDHRAVLPVRNPNYNPNDPSSEEFLKDSDGEVLTKVVQNFPVDKILETLSNVITGWRGLVKEDDDGNSVEVPYSVENIPALFEEELAVKETKDIKGKQTEVTTPYWQWLTRKIQSGDTFDADPKAKG